MRLGTIDTSAPDRIFQPLEEAAPSNGNGHHDPFESAPIVTIGTDEHRVADETIVALKADDQLFHRGGTLVHVVRDENHDDHINRQAGAPTIILAPSPWVRERITRHVQLQKVVRRKGKTCESSAHPPQWLVQAVAARGEWPNLRRLTAISNAPVLRPGGSVHQVAGYDSATGVLFLPATKFPSINDRATQADATEAAKRVIRVVCDFRFEQPEHQSAWLSALLTPLARHAYSGPSPGFLVDANVRGAGKSLACHLIGEIVTGCSLPVCGYLHKPSEFAKLITAIAIAGDPVVLLDNITGTFGDEVLDRALTATRWKDRILGVSQNVDLPWLTTMLATGNNVAVAADTARRLIHIRLDVLDEKPEERAGFTHPNLLGWVRQNRPVLLSDALTILAAYCRADRPDQHLTSFGSFEGWSALVRSAVVWCGLLDPCLTRTHLAETADTATDSMHELIAAWQGYDPSGRGVVVAEMVTSLYPRDYAPVGPEAVAMRAALEAITCCPAGKNPSTRQVANRLKTIRRRVVGGCYLDIDAGQNRNQGATWRLFDAKNEGHRDSEDSRDSLYVPSRETSPRT